MTISEDCLRLLPVGRFVRFQKILDADNKEKDCVVWSFIDRDISDIRKSYFDLMNGDYLGEAF